MSLNGSERETVVNADDDSEVVRIWSAQRRYITKMRRDPMFTEIESGFYGDSEYAVFTIPADRWSPVGVKRSRNQSSSARESARKRLLAAKGVQE